MPNGILKNLTSQRSMDIPEAISIKFNQWVDECKASGQDIITLSLGEAFFDLPDPSFDGLNLEKGYHYTDSQGVPDLRNKIANYLNKCHGTSVCANENIIISAGSKIIIFMCILAKINPGDEVLVFEPAWLSYEHQISLAGGKTTFIPIDSSLAEAEKYITHRTKLVIFNNPNNPAGRVYTQVEMMTLSEICKRNRVTLIVDEAYGDFVENGQFYSIINIEPELEHVVAVNSLSKTMGISGWRIGYAVCNQHLMKTLLKLNQHLITCAPSILQIYVAANFQSLLDKTLPQAKSFNTKRKEIAAHLDKARITHTSGSSTFYFFLDLSNYYGDTSDLAETLLFTHNIAMVPGAAYGNSTKGYLRMSIGTESVERIISAIDTLADIIKQKGLMHSKIV